MVALNKKLLLSPLVLILSFSIFDGCKKKTSTEVTVFDYALDEPVSGASVVLVERHQNGWGSTTCKEIASGTTDETGKCSFNNEKLKKNKNYAYYFAFASLYGQETSYPCEGKASGFIEKGKSSEVILPANSVDGNLIVQENNLLNPSQTGDSISIQIISAAYTIPGESGPTGGGGVLNTYAYHGMNGYPFPAVLTSNPIKTPCGFKIAKIRKKKMGVVSYYEENIKVRPFETTTFVINW